MRTEVLEGRLMWSNLLCIRNFFIVVFISFSCITYSQEITVRGIIFDRDSITPMPFAYAANKNSSIGTLTDEKGRFYLHMHIGDTLSFSYLGYNVTRIFTRLLKDSVKNNLLSIKVFLKPKITELKPVIIASHSFTKEEKEYYEGKVNTYKRQTSSLFSVSPTGAGLDLDALYLMFSKKGKELEKLSVLYQQLLVDEMKEHRISAEKVRAITGSDTLDVKEFLNYCYLPDQFVLSASDYDLYYAVHRYYKQYMEMLRRK